MEASPGLRAGEATKGGCVEPCRREDGRLLGGTGDGGLPPTAPKPGGFATTCWSAPEQECFLAGVILGEGALLNAPVTHTETAKRATLDPSLARSGQPTAQGRPSRHSIQNASQQVLAEAPSLSLDSLVGRCRGGWANEERKHTPQERHKPTALTVTSRLHAVKRREW